MIGLLSELGATIPVVAAPMAGGPSTPELVVAAGAAGGIGFLAAGYKSAEALQEEITAVRAASVAFGVNLFAPNPVPVNAGAYARYRDALRVDAERLGVDLPAAPREDGDAWRDKIDLLAADPVPVVSFTFGIPDRSVVDLLHRAGSLLVQTITSSAEAVAAAEAGVDALVVQASAAGGHSGTLTPHSAPPETPLAELVAQAADAVTLPLLAAGGVDTPQAVTAVLRAGAGAAVVGTALLLAPEAGTSPAHRGALIDPLRGPTIVTWAFTGRPARALPNAFLAHHDGEAPVGYPALHHLTGPLRRASAAAGDPEHVNLWAGQHYRSAREAPAADVLTDLASEA